MKQRKTGWRGSELSISRLHTTSCGLYAYMNIADERVAAAAAADRATVGSPGKNRRSRRCNRETGAATVASFEETGVKVQ